MTKKKEKAKVETTDERQTQAIKVDFGIPLPEKRRTMKYPWDELKNATDPLASFFVAGKSVRKASGLYTVARKHGLKVSIADDEQDGVKGVRVFRVHG